MNGANRQIFIKCKTICPAACVYQTATARLIPGVDLGGAHDQIARHGGVGPSVFTRGNEL